MSELRCRAERLLLCQLWSKPPHTDITLREFLHDATAELTQLEGKVPKTLKALLLHPGRLTLDFLAGRRARWLPPLRLYLIWSVAYFLSDAIVGRITHRSERAISEAMTTNPDGSTTLTPEGSIIATAFVTSETILVIVGSVVLAYIVGYGVVALWPTLAMM